MAKTPLIERMEKAKAPKTWTREVKTKDDRIERLIQLKETYLNIIDRLAREKEQLEAHIGCLLKGIKEWDLADAPDESVKAFLADAQKGEYLSP